MASNGFNLVKLIFNLFLLGAILYGAWFGYNKFIAEPGAQMEYSKTAIKHMDEKKWHDALATIDEMEKKYGPSDLMKEKKLVCYINLGQETHEEALEVEVSYRRTSRSYADSKSDTDREKMEKYSARREQLFRECLGYYEHAEKYGSLKRLDIMNRASAYMAIGDRANANKWSMELKNYPE